MQTSEDIIREQQRAVQYGISLSLAGKSGMILRCRFCSRWATELALPFSTLIIQGSK